MAAPHLQINQTDLSVFMRVAHEDGLDPADSDYSEPQFSGSPAFSEGAGYVGDAVGNREMVFPLFLSAESEADLHQLIRDINQELTRGASVEYASSADGEVTYFDLERGRLEVEYRYWISRAVRTRATLRLWTRPYGHTGTSRAVASFVGTHGVLQFVATGIGGDMPARADLSCSMASLSGAKYGILGAAGVKHPYASGYDPVLTNGRIASRAVMTASVFGDSNRVGSQYVGFRATSAVGENTLFTVPLRPQDAGRYRLLALLRSEAAGATGSPELRVKLRQGSAPYPALVQALSMASKAYWSWHDLGEYHVTPTIAAQQLEFVYSATTGLSFSATYPVKINALVSVPLDHSAAILAAPGNLNGDYYEIRTGEGFSLRSIENKAALQTATDGAILRDLTPHRRGGAIEIPVTGASSMPSGPAHVVLVAGVNFGNEGSDMPGNTSHDVRVAVRERFQFLR